MRKIITTTINQIRELSPEEKEIFEGFDLQQRKDSKFVKFQDGEKKVLRFDTTKAPVRGESKIYTGKINWGFTVYDTQLGDGRLLNLEPAIFLLGINSSTFPRRGKQGRPVGLNAIYFAQVIDEMTA